MLELADGSTFVTSAERLRATLAQTHPELLGPNGEILLEKLRAEGARRARHFGEAVGGLVAQGVHLCRRRRRRDDDHRGHDKTQVADAAELGVSWAGTKALMWAIEKRLKPAPGLYRWTGASGSASDLEGQTQLQDCDERTPKRPRSRCWCSCTARVPARSAASATCAPASRDLWAALERKFTGGIYAFEHRTLSESPIDNALQLAEALPEGAHVSLVSHSRGGLVADLLCLGDFDALIDRYSYALRRHRRRRSAPRDRSAVLGELRRPRTPSTATSCASSPPCCASEQLVGAALRARRQPGAAAPCSPAATSTSSCPACSR